VTLGFEARRAHRIAVDRGGGTRPLGAAEPRSRSGAEFVGGEGKQRDGHERRLAAHVAPGKHGEEVHADGAAAIMRAR
jgi:hypothetical protein